MFCHVVICVHDIELEYLDRVHELGCYLEVELSSYIGVLRARSTLWKERIRVRRMHGSASVG